MTATTLPGVLLIRPRVFPDERGHFLELWREQRYREAGLPARFVQDNVAYSTRGVLRGLHYQCPEPQGKLVTALYGEVFDVAVDIRRGSPTFGRWYGTTLSAKTGAQLWVPEGFAHGYCVLSEESVVGYKCTRPYHPEGDATVLWSDADIGVDWPVDEPILSDKDAAAPALNEIDSDRLPPLAQG